MNTLINLRVPEKDKFDRFSNYKLLHVDSFKTAAQTRPVDGKLNTSSGGQTVIGG